MRTTLTPFVPLLSLAILASLAAAGEPVSPPVFSDPLLSTNPYAPFEGGALKVYQGKDEGAKITVVDLYLEDTRTFLLDGELVECHTLLEIEFEDGELIEISRNFFAEADDATVYYFGETVDDYEEGEIVGHGGSWLVGGPTRPDDPEDTATALAPAVFFPADPEVGDSWKPEDLFPFVDETVTLQKDDKKLKVPAGKYEDVLQVEETTQLDSGSELKWYAAGVGVLKAQGSSEKLVLVASTLLSSEDVDG